MRLLAFAAVLLGWISVVAGVGLIYPPAALITAGLFMGLIGLLIDYDRGGKRETGRRASRT